MNLNEYKQKLFRKDPKFKTFYNTYDLAFEVGQMILEARSRKKITQKKLAEMMHTKQSSIARAESGNYLPSLSFLNTMASVLKTNLRLNFEFMSNTLSSNKTETASKNEIFLGKTTFINQKNLYHTNLPEIKNDSVWKYILN